MKKFGVFVIFLLVSSLLVGMVSAADIGGIEDNIDSVAETGEDIREGIDDARSGALKEQWAELLKKNKLVSGVDGALEKGNIVFVVLFREDYGINLKLFFIIILWGILFIVIDNFLVKYAPFSRWVSVVVAAIFSVIFAQIGIYAIISDFFVGLIFNGEGFWWMVLRFGIISIILVVIFIFFRGYSSRLGKSFRERKIMIDEAMKETRQEVLERRMADIGRMHELIIAAISPFGGGSNVAQAPSSESGGIFPTLRGRVGPTVGGPKPRKTPRVVDTGNNYDVPGHPKKKRSPVKKHNVKVAGKDFNLLEAKRKWGKKK